MYPTTIDNNNFVNSYESRMVGKPFVIGFLLAFWDLPCTTFNSNPIILKSLTNRNIALIYPIVYGQGASFDEALLARYIYLQYFLFIFLTSGVFYKKHIRGVYVSNLTLRTLLRKKRKKNFNMLVSAYSGY